MVVFNELEMEGFKRYDSHKTYKFNEGLIGIFGKNESGKSTMGDAISVALFGLSSTTYKKADIVTWGKSNAKIRLDFETDIKYRVERNIGRTNRAILKKYNNNRWEVISKTIKNVDSQIKDILGLDFKSFKNSIFIAQNDLNSLSSLSKNERQTIINKLSRYDELSKAEGVLKDDLKVKRRDLEMLGKDLEHLQEEVDNIRGKYNDLLSLREEYDIKDELLKDHKKHLDKIKDDIKISKELKKIKDLSEKVDDLKKQIEDKEKEIARIELKELDVKSSNKNIEQLKHVNKELKKRIDKIEDIVSQIQQNQIDKEKTDTDIEFFKKRISDLNASIEKKDEDIGRILGKEKKKKELEGKLDEFSHITPQLKTKVDDINNTMSKIFTNNRDLKRLQDEKSEIGIIKDEKELKKNHASYKEFLNLDKDSKTIAGEIDSLENKIKETKESLGDLIEEKGDLSEVESNYESAKSQANIYIVSGVVASLLGIILGLTFNIYLIFLLFIGLVPLYKGYKDKNHYQGKLNHIKEKREIFGQLKQLEIQKDEKNTRLNSLKQEMKKFDNRDLKSLKKDYEHYDDLENVIKKLDQINSDISDTKDKIKRLKEDLNKSFTTLPVHYQEKLSIDDDNLGNENLKLYQNEDKNKGVCESTIKQLSEEISRKDKLIQEKQEHENKKIDLESQKSEKENSKKEIFKQKESINKQLREEFDGLPIYYKDKVSFDDENMYKEILKIYQNEDKQKGKIEASIKEIMSEIKRKPEIFEKKEKLESDKDKLEIKILDLKNKLKDLTDKKNLEYDALKHESLRREEKKLSDTIGVCVSKLGTINGRIKSLEKDTEGLKDKSEKLDNLKEENEKLQFEYDVADIAKNEISNTAKMLREQVMERTRKHVYYLLPKITNNKYRDVKITEDFKIKVYSPEKNEFESINSLSGGAMDQVLFSLRLAFTNSILGGTSRSKGFALFLDEFLGSFDQSRRDETLKMLKELKDHFRQIFLISHIDGMEGNVDQVIKTPEI